MMEKENLDYDDSEMINILLFGYSELVIKALCGFRDLLIGQQVNNDTNMLNRYRKGFYNTVLEENASQKIRLFICEGQPKTQIGRMENLLYHDGFQYANSLLERNFKNVILIPDAVVGNIIQNNHIHFIMVGANGFTNEFFKHSSGHSSVVNLAREYRSRNKSAFPKVVLVTSVDKWSACAPLEEEQKDGMNDSIQIEGYTFWRGLQSTKIREHIWFIRDEEISKKLQDQDFMLYNPREDIIPIEFLDHIILDTGFHKIFSANKDELDRNKLNFNSKKKLKGLFS
ncbi:hypothetical protein [Candidatus Formimonas warabiya]|nr:hypothetical protein [Candidatus Formimonas warabiya]